ncbi:MAG: hypothetical protein PVI87_00475 [Gammaproteobacteria bacterium]|jgi:hypothetical protein
MIRELFANWRFRSARPMFAPGEEIRAYLTGFDGGTLEGTMRIGDTVLVVDGADSRHMDRLVTVRIESFDAARGTGRARLTPS